MSAASGEVVPDRGPSVIAIYWVESAVAILVVALRFYGRLISSKLGKDDYVMLFTLVLFLILSGFATFLAKNGGFRHQFDLSPEQQLRAVKYNWITQVWGISGLVTGKVSVALQLQRIIGPNNKRTRWILYALIISLSVVSIVDCIITFTQCSPPHALWEPSVPHTCWDSKVQGNYAIFVGVYNVVGDLILALLPIGILMKTSLSLQKRLATMALLGLGIVAAACGIVKVTCLVTLSARADFTWSTYSLYIWTGLEFWMIIVCGSIPPIRPILSRLFGSGKRTGYSSDAFTSGGYSEFSSKPRSQSRGIKQYFADASGPPNTVLSDSASDTQILQSRVEIEAKACTGDHGHQQQEDSTKIVRMTDIVIETTRSKH